jgi:hypothetical protein
MSKALKILTQFPANRQLALYNILGGPKIVEDILAGNVTVQIKKTARKLVDKHGRFIPLGLSSPVVDADYRYHFNSFFDREECFSRMAEAFNCYSMISVDDYIGRVRKIIERVRNDEQLSQLLLGTNFLVLLPKIDITDYGRTLAEVFIPKLKQAYGLAFSNGNFNIYEPVEELIGEISLIDGSRYDKLVEAMAKGPVAAIYFPTAFQGFSPLAAREMIQTLPGDVILSGGYDISAAIIGCPMHLARGNKMPVLQMSAFKWQSPESLLEFKPSIDELTFNDSKLNYQLSLVDVAYSSGVTIIG